MSDSIHLIQEIQREYDRLRKFVAAIPASLRNLKTIDGPGGKVSVNDLIAYQIGWGKCVIRWYKAGLKEKMPAMPLEGFAKWDYAAIARHFYQKYHYARQDQVFHRVVLQLLEIVETEHRKGRLEKLGVWPWCTLSSGKQWPLSKWIQVNTCAPYKRAYLLIRKEFKEKMHEI